MHLFLTSSPCSGDMPGGVALPCILNEANGFVRRMLECWKPDSRVLLIAASPNDAPLNDEMADTFARAFSYHGLTHSRFTLLDARNERDAARLAALSDAVILGGGHVPTQNAFFSQLGLRNLLSDYPGVIMGISAGSMNCAEVVYAHPEEEGEAVDPEYQRWLPGLGITPTMVLPHYQDNKDGELDGMRLYEDIAYPDSMGGEFLCMVDGTYLLICDGEESVHGESYWIRNGELYRNF